jgi:hypothetical protein
MAIYYQEARLGMDDQVIRWTAPEGRPDGDADVSISLAGGTVAPGPAWPQAVTILPGSAALAVAATAGQRVLTLAVGGGATLSVGEAYQLQATSGRRSEIIISAIAGDVITLQIPIRHDAATGSTVVSATYQYELATATVSTLARRMQVLWEYEVGGRAFAHTQTLSIVREPFALAVEEGDLAAHDPAISEYLDAAGQWRLLLGGAHQDLIRKLAARQMYPDLIRDRWMLRDALAFMVLSKFYRSIPGQQDRANAWSRDAAQAIEEMARAYTWYDSDGDGRLGSSEERMRSHILPIG